MNQDATRVAIVGVEQRHQAFAGPLWQVRIRGSVKELARNAGRGRLRMTASGSGGNVHPLVEIVSNQRGEERMSNHDKA